MAKKAIEIWQTDDRNKMFVGSRIAKREGWKIVKDKSYKLVYKGEVDVDGNGNAALEQIYSKFQGTKPEGYNGRSISVGDMVKMDGDTHFVDDYGFTKLSKKAAMGMSNG